MDKLKKFISENAELFDDSEPDAGHFKRFRKMLEQEAVAGNPRIDRRMILKIAATVLFLIATSVIVFQLAVNRINWSADNSGANANLGGEMEDALRYYDGQTDSRLKEFNRLACCGEEQIHLNKLVSSELNAIDANIEELKQGLINDPQNERIQAAIVQNQQMKSQVLDNMIEQMKRTKGER